jgi:hypothetical protein
MSRKIAKEDWKFMQEKPEGDPDFNEKRSRAVINNTIKKYEAIRAARSKFIEEGVRERSDAISSWVASMNGSGKPIDQYLGRKWMAYFRGEEIVAKLREKLRLVGRQYPNIINE